MNKNGAGKIGSPTFSRPIKHENWAKEALRAIQGRDTLRNKEIDMFKMRQIFFQEIRLRPTIIEIFMFLSSTNELGLLAKSILVELGEDIGKVEIPENIEGRKIYHAVRLKILIRQPNEARAILNKIKDPREKHKINMALLRDPNEARVVSSVRPWVRIDV